MESSQGIKKFEIVQRPIALASEGGLVKLQKDRHAIPRIGISKILWAPTRPLLATVNENSPQVVWIWDAARIVLLSVLVHTSRIRGISWAPFGDLLAICGGDDCLRLWSPAGCSSIVVPHDSETDFQIRKFFWNPMPSSRQIMMIDHENSFCCCSM